LKKKVAGLVAQRCLNNSFFIRCSFVAWPHATLQRLLGSITRDCSCVEETLKASQLFQKQNKKCFGLAATAIVAGMILMAVSAFAQEGAMSPYQNEQDGVSAGGKWIEFRSEDKMTGAKKVRFELLANNYFRQDQDFKPRVEVTCTDGKYQYSDFNMGGRLGRPDYPGFWGQPKMEVQVRIDGSHDHKGWNWVRGRFLAMDKGTVRGVIGAQLFNLEVRTRSGPQIAEFSPGGLNLDEVKHVCDLTPHKP
jgi:hypothetical protein